ncbi:MAG: Ig-like domain-containing protein [Anaerolineae bacterium]
MSKTNRLTIAGLALLAGLILLLRNGDLAGATPSRQGAPVVFSNRDFDPPNWTVQVVAVGNPLPSSLTERRTLDGNPGNFRFTRDTFPAAGLSSYHTITTLHKYDVDPLAGTYDPAVRGPIGHIDYQVDQILLRATPANRAHTVYTYLLIFQDGIIYQGGQTIVDSPTWQTDTVTGLQAGDFHELNNPTSGRHPDFSAQGSPLQFGYARDQGQRFSAPMPPSPEDLVTEHGLDNWQVIVWSPITPGNRPPSAFNDIEITDDSYTRGYTFIDVLANDTDPDGDRLVITAVTTPTYGTAQIVASRGIDYYRPFRPEALPDSFNYTISDGEFSSTARVSIFFDCGCTSECLTGASVGAAANTLDLDLLRRLRDRVMKPTPHGHRYVDMYYTTTPEIVTILMLNRTDLGDEAVALVELWQDNLYSLVDGDGSARVTQAQVDAIETFLNHLSAAASPELQQLIATELARLGPLDSYVGLTVKAAKSKAIGDPLLYLPLIVK